MGEPQLWLLDRRSGGRYRRPTLIRQHGGATFAFFDDGTFMVVLASAETPEHWNNVSATSASLRWCCQLPHWVLGCPYDELRTAEMFCRALEVVRSATDDEVDARVVRCCDGRRGVASRRPKS